MPRATAKAKAKPKKTAAKKKETSGASRSSKGDLFKKKLERLIDTLEKANKYAEGLRGYLPKIKPVEIPTASEVAQDSGFGTMQELIEDLMQPEATDSKPVGAICDVMDRCCDILTLVEGECGFEL